MRWKHPSTVVVLETTQGRIPGMIPIMLRMIKRSVFYLLCVCVFCIASMIVTICTFHTITHLTLQTYEVIYNFILDMKKKNKTTRTTRSWLGILSTPVSLLWIHNDSISIGNTMYHSALLSIISVRCLVPLRVIRHSRVKTDSELWHVASQVSKFRMRRSLKSFTLISAGTPMCYHLKHTLGAIPPACNLPCHVDVLNTPPKTWDCEFTANCTFPLVHTQTVNC